MRVIAAIFAGLVACVAIVMVGVAFAAGYFGDEFMYEVKDDYLFASAKFSAVILAVGLVAGIVGGWLAAKIGGHKAASAVFGLVGLIIVFGVAEIVLNVMQEPKPLEGRTVEQIQEIPSTELPQYIKRPAWTVFGNPLVGVVGVMLGGAIGRSKSKPEKAKS